MAVRNIVAAIAALAASAGAGGAFFANATSATKASGLYVLVLELMAIKATNRFGWGPTIGAYLIPGLAVLLVCCCAAAVLTSVMGLALGDVWSTINGSMIGIQ